MVNRRIKLKEYLGLKKQGEIDFESKNVLGQHKFVGLKKIKVYIKILRPQIMFPKNSMF